MEQLLKRRAELNAKIDELLANDKLTAEQVAAHDALVAEYEANEKRIEIQDANDARAEKARADMEAREKAALEKARAARPVRKTAPDDPHQARGTVGETVPAQPIDHQARGRLGFSTFRTFLADVRDSSVNRRTPQRLIDAYQLDMYAAVIGNSEGIGSDGGFLVPPTFSNQIFARLTNNENLLSRTDQYTIGGNTISFPRVKDDDRRTGYRNGGVAAYWVDEGGAGTIEKPGFGKLNLTLKKLLTLAAMTSELESDSSMAMEQFLFRVCSEEITWTVNEAILNGTGAGQPAGVYVSPCRVTVTKESGQTADTIVPANIVKMWSRMHAPSRANAVWLINQDTEPQLNLMSFGLGTSGQMLYMPPGGLASTPYATLMGRPVIATEHNPTLGDEGDIALVDLKQYAVALKGGMNQQVSMHFYFDTDQMCYRITFRIDGQPWWEKSLTPAKGSATQSPFVTLQAR